MSLNRTLAGLITTTGDVKSANLDNAASLTVYATKEDLPSSGMSSGDQAYVTGNSRFYISNGSGWYNVALINATPSLSIDPTGTIQLATDGSTTTITLTATDSDNAVAGLTYSVESDGSFGGLASLSQDSSVFTITPLSEDSATTTSAVLTFKASDGISFGSGSRTLTLSFKVINSNYTTLLLKNEETTDNQADASTNAHTITENGDVKSTAFSPYHPGGYSMYFDGTNDYVGVAYNQSIVDWASADWTCEYWMWAEDIDNWNYVSGGNENPSSVGHGAHNAVTNYWSFGPLANGGVRFYYYNGSPVYTATTSSGLVSSKTWHHLAAVHSSGTLKIYVDGTLATTHSVSGTPQYDAGYGLPIGSINSRYIDGYIRDLRIVNAAVYTDAFTPPTASLTAITNTQVLLGHKPYVSDGSGNDHSLTIDGPSTKRFGPYDHLAYSKADHGGSVYFDGTGDYMTASTIDLPIGQEAYTIEAYVYNTTINRNTICGWGAASNYNSNALRVNDAGNGFLNYWYAEDLDTGDIGLQTNVWYHVAATYDGTTRRIFVNGVNKAQDTPGSHTISVTNNFTIGKSPLSAAEYMTGYISDLRISDTAKYTSNFTAPTAPLTAISGTQFLSATNKNDIWDAAAGAVPTKAGDVAGGGNSGTLKFNKTAIYFDGTGDYLDFVKKDEYHFGSSDDFTVEGWWYFASSPNSTTIPLISMGTGVDATPAHYSDWIMYRNGSNQLSFGQYDNVSYVFRDFGTWQPTDSTWYHVAISRNGTDLRAFIDGTQHGSTITDSTAWTGKSGSRPLRLGLFYGSGGVASYFNGYAQDVRITYGLARYTANFTPPTTEFSG